MFKLLYVSPILYLLLLLSVFNSSSLPSYLILSSLFTYSLARPMILLYAVYESIILGVPSTATPLPSRGCNLLVSKKKRERERERKKTIVTNTNKSKAEYNNNNRIIQYYKEMFSTQSTTFIQHAHHHSNKTQHSVTTQTHLQHHITCEHQPIKHWSHQHINNTQVPSRNMI